MVMMINSKMLLMQKTRESVGHAQIMGQERFKADQRQLGGLLMLLGATALVFPMANVASRIGPNGSTGEQPPIGLASLVAGVFVMWMGLMSIPLGYLQAVHDWGHAKLTGFAILWTQLAWMPFLTDLSMVGIMTVSGEPGVFIPPAYNPSPTDVRLVGSMGIMGILGYGTGFLGSLAFVQFSLFAFQSGKPGDRPGPYFQSRLAFYSGCLFLVGLSQMLLGAYLISAFGLGPYKEKGPIAVAMYMVFFPEISIFVGLLQMINAVFGLARSLLNFHKGRHDNSFQVMVLMEWYFTVALQIMTQVSYAPADMAAAAAPSQTMLTLGLHVMVAYLDYKMRTTPRVIPDNYYGLDALDKDGNTQNLLPLLAMEGDEEEVMEMAPILPQKKKGTTNLSNYNL